MHFPCFQGFTVLASLFFPLKPCQGSPPSIPSSYLLLLLLFLLLREEGVNPPDLGEHAAVRQAEAEAEQPEAELQERGTVGREERDERLFVRTRASAGAGAVCQLLHELLLVFFLFVAHYCSVFAFFWLFQLFCSALLALYLVYSPFFDFREL